MADEAKFIVDEKEIEKLSLLLGFFIYLYLSKVLKM